MKEDLLDRLSALLPQQFDLLLGRLNLARGHFLPNNLPMLERALELIRYYEQPGHQMTDLEVALAILDCRPEERDASDGSNVLRVGGDVRGDAIVIGNGNQITIGRPLHRPTKK